MGPPGAPFRLGPGAKCPSCPPPPPPPVGGPANNVLYCISLVLSCMFCMPIYCTVYTSLCYYHTNDVPALGYWWSLDTMPLLCYICHHCAILRP